MRGHNRENNVYADQAHALFLGALLGWECAVSMRAVNINIIEAPRMASVSWAIGRIMLFAQGRRNVGLTYAAGFIGGAISGVYVYDLVNPNTNPEDTVTSDSSNTDSFKP